MKTGPVAQQNNLTTYDSISAIESYQPTDDMKLSAQEIQPNQGMNYAQVKLTRPQFKGSVEDYVMITNFKRFKRKGSTSKYKGVFYVKKEKKYRAQICLKGKKKYVGTFKNDFDAAVARDQRIREMFGEVEELLNFPKSDASYQQIQQLHQPIQQQQPPPPTTQQTQNFRRLPRTLGRYGSSACSTNSFGMNFDAGLYNQVMNSYIQQVQDIAVPPPRMAKRFSSSDSTFSFLNNCHFPQPQDINAFQSGMFPPETQNQPYQKPNEPDSKRLKTE